MPGLLARERRCVAVLFAVLAALLWGVVMSPQGAATAAERSAHPGASLRQDSFPGDYFFIRNVVSGKVLDVRDGSTDAGASVLLWDRKPRDNDNQLWKYDEGFIVNKNSGLVLEVPGYEGGGNIKPGTSLVQAERRAPPHSLNQLWAYNYSHLMPYDPKVCLWGENGDVSTPGVNAVVDRCDIGDVSQEWMLDLP